MTWFSGYEAIVRTDVPLAPYTWYKLGGPARWLCEPRELRELAAILRRCAQAGVRSRLLGNGANVLIGDQGVDAAVVRLCSPAFTDVTISDNLVTAGAGADFPRLVRKTLDADLVGLETLAGIPGTLGGVVRMNAGGRYGEIGRFVESVALCDAQGTVSVRDSTQLDFTYRGSNLDDCVILAARLALEHGDGAAALRRHRTIWTEKYRDQPAHAQRSAGCVFKNPPTKSAGRLIESCGLKGASIGGARISERHANFIIAEAGAVSEDVLGLIRLARKRVNSEQGVELELELELI